MSRDVCMVHVPLGERAYDIAIGSGLLAQAGQYVLPHKRVIIVSDRQVAGHYLTTLEASLDAAGIRHDAVLVDAGEASKSFSVFERVMNELLALQPDRKTVLLALGGGVVGDLCGFAASVLMRGVPFIQIPTSLLAQVDSSVGGKTGINTQAGKNLVGSFYQPEAVLIDTDTLASLPPRELRAGYAEIVKYGLIGDAAFFEWLEAKGDAVLAGDKAAQVRAIQTSCEAKADTVARDEREGGARALLNLGHTFGHVLEAECGYSGELVHGEAVAIGMVMACRLSQEMGLIDGALEARLVAHLGKMGLPVSPKDIRGEWNVDALCEHFYADKKAEGGALTFIVLEALGQARVSKAVDAALARRVVEAFVL